VYAINDTASAGSQATFLKFQRIEEQYRSKPIVNWVPGYCNIQGNEPEDKLAKERVEAEHGARVISQPTLAYLKRKAKAARTMAFRNRKLHRQPKATRSLGS
jgi:hypothetical protein